MVKNDKFEQGSTYNKERRSSKKNSLRKNKKFPYKKTRKKEN